VAAEKGKRSSFSSLRWGRMGSEKIFRNQGKTKEGMDTPFPREDKLRKSENRPIFVSTVKKYKRIVKFRFGVELMKANKIRGLILGGSNGEKVESLIPLKLRIATYNVDTGRVLPV